MMYSKHSSRFFEEVEKRLAEAAAKHEFGILHIHHLGQTLESKGIDLGSECRVYDVCNPQAAYQALRTDMRVSTVLPCRISVFGEGYTIAAVNPTSMLAATGLDRVASLAEEVEREDLAIIDEAAWT